jgi:hypothetical protein
VQDTADGGSLGKIDIGYKSKRQKVDISRYVASMRLLQGRILMLLDDRTAKFRVTPGHR